MRDPPEFDFCKLTAVSSVWMTGDSDAFDAILVKQTGFQKLHRIRLGAQWLIHSARDGQHVFDTSLAGDPSQIILDHGLVAH